MPRFAARVEQKCNLCHVSPTGGGMRNTYGAQYFALTELAVHKVPLEEITKFQPYVSDNISLGMDGRMLYFYDENVEQSSFFQMEGNLYIDAQVTERFQVSYFPGLYTGFEVFATGYFLPFQGYVRAGKFQPSYGWRFADHTNFVREKMLWPPNSFDTGMEFGIYPHKVSATLGFFNGSGSQLDSDKGKAMAARFEYRPHFGKIGLGLGGSYWRNDRTVGAINMYGPMYYMNLFSGKIIYMGEFDWLEDERADITMMAATQSLTLMLTQGIWLEGKYDFHDPDTDFKGGAVSRYSFNLDYFPIGFLEIEPSLRFYSDEIIDDDYIMYVQQFHFFF